MSILTLINPARAFLAMSTILAGYCLLRFYAFTSGNLLIVPYLLAAGALLAMAESAWRAIFAAAAAVDADAPQPSGTGVSTTAAYFTASFTTLAGLMCAMTGGFNSFRAAGALVILGLARAALFRRTEILSPLLAGLLAGGLFVLGMTAHPAFAEMLLIVEARTPAAFYALYIVAAAVLAQTRDSAHPRAAPSGDDLSGETAARLLELRGDSVDGIVAWFGGGALAVIPLALAWVMPWRWLSWAFLAFLSVATLLRLAPVLVYRTRKDLGEFVASAYRGGALLLAGGVASLGDYQQRELYAGWSIPAPANDELGVVLAIALLAFPAWLLRRVAPVD